VLVEKFTLTFKFVNGNVKQMHIESANYDEVTKEIIKNGKWFGRTGELVNLDNVITVEIKVAH
jgi:hypothetical protein